MDDELSTGDDLIYGYLPWDLTTASAGQPDESQLKKLSRQGVSWIINLGLLGSDYALPDEAGLVKRLGMQYRYIPVQWEAPHYDDFLQFLTVMRASNGNKRLDSLCCEL